MPTASRICVRYSSLPWKYFSSVSTDIADAPVSSYLRAIATGSKSGRMIPFEGEAFLTSAIRRMSDRADRTSPSPSLVRRGAMAALKSKGGSASRAIVIRYSAGALL